MLLARVLRDLRHRLRRAVRRLRQARQRRAVRPPGPHRVAAPALARGVGARLGPVRVHRVLRVGARRQLAAPARTGRPGRGRLARLLLARPVRGLAAPRGVVRLLGRGRRVGDGLREGHALTERAHADRAALRVVRGVATVLVAPVRVAVLGLAVLRAASPPAAACPAPLGSPSGRRPAGGCSPGRPPCDRTSG